jgi:hypothetical protein
MRVGNRGMCLGLVMGGLIGLGGGGFGRDNYVAHSLGRSQNNEKE